MNYLVVSHIPFALGSSPALVRADPDALADFAAQAAARRAVGMRMMIAAPAVPAHHPAAGPCTSDEFAPDEYGFELLHLPVYQSMRAYLRVRKRMTDALRRAIAAADIVQLGCGGHPMMLGEVGWPIVAEMGKPRVWTFDAVDPFAPSDLRSRGGIARRVLRNRLTAHQIRFCRNAIAEADVVFAHHPGIAARFAPEWRGHCHVLDAPLFGADDLPTESQILMRAAARTDKFRPLKLVTFAPQCRDDPAGHLIRALAHCRRLSVPLELSIIGSAAAAAAMMQLAGELAMIDFVRRIDSPDSVENLLHLAGEFDAMITVAGQDIIEREIFPAMGGGLPVVAYENPASDRLIESADTGIVVPGGNVLLLAQSIIELHGKRRLLNRLGENAWRKAASRTRECIHRRRADIVAAALGIETQAVGSQ